MIPPPIYRLIALLSREEPLLPPMSRSSFNQHHKPMFDIIEPSVLRAQFSLSKPGVREASFSSYLPPANGAVSPSTKHGADDSEISIFDADKYFNGVHDQNGNGGTPKRSDVSSVPRISSVSSIDDSSYGRNYRARSFHATPTASSEASWNSQSGLLSRPAGLAAVSIKNIPDSINNSKSSSSSSSSRWFPLRCRCPCSGKKSVEVKETNMESKSPGPFYLKRSNSGGSSVYSSRNDILNRSQLQYDINPKVNTNGFPSNRNHQAVASGRSFTDSNGTTSNGFTFPILNSTAPSVKRMFNIITTVAGSEAEEPPRDSLEVFQPRENPQSGGKERQSFMLPGSPRSRRASYDEEIGSDGSSDLFEIESFSTQATSYNPAQRDSLDEKTAFNVKRLVGVGGGIGGGGVNSRRSIDEPMTPSVAATECYPPSEVSVDWSVVTAEGFDRASLANFSVAASEAEGVIRESEKNERGSGGGEDVGGSKRRGNGLLSCRCEKAINVGPGPIKCGLETGRGGPAGVNGPVSSTMRHVSSRAQSTANVAKPPLALGKARSSLLSVSASFAT